MRLEGKKVGLTNSVGGVDGSITPQWEARGGVVAIPTGGGEKRGGV